MTVWSTTTKPTRANAKKRLNAAIAALEGAEHILKQLNDVRTLRETGYAYEWLRGAISAIDHPARKRVAK